jgi:asparagine synthase (glutamine-hydrolysing)
MSREKITVALTGIGGDELFLGYPRYLGAKVYCYYTKIPYFFRNKISSLSKFIPEPGSSRDWLGRIKRFLKNSNLNLDMAYKLWITSINSDTKDILYTEEMKSYLTQDINLDFGIENYSKLLSQNFFENIFYFELKTYLTDDLLCLADRMSMANSLELRVPFCDVKLVEFMNKIPFSLKMKNNKMKYLLKKIMNNILPKEIIYQKKMGFMIPLRRWLSEESDNLFKEYLNESVLKKRKIFNPEIVNWMINQHLTGRKNFSDQIWSLLVLEEWFRQFVK